MKGSNSSKRQSFAKEMTIVVCVKVAVLTAIWALFFSQPEAEHVNDARLVAHLVA